MEAVLAELDSAFEPFRHNKVINKSHYYLEAEVIYYGCVGGDFNVWNNYNGFL